MVARRLATFSPSFSPSRITATRPLSARAPNAAISRACAAVEEGRLVRPPARPVAVSQLSSLQAGGAGRQGEISTSTTLTRSVTVAQTGTADKDAGTKFGAEGAPASRPHAVAAVVMAVIKVTSPGQAAVVSEPRPSTSKLHTVASNESLVYIHVARN